MSPGKCLLFGIERDFNHCRFPLERPLDVTAIWLPVGCGRDPHEARLRGIVRQDGPIYPGHGRFIRPGLGASCIGLAT